MIGGNILSLNSFRDEARRFMQLAGFSYIGKFIRERDLCFLKSYMDKYKER